MSHFGHLSKKMSGFRKKLLTARTDVCAQRAVITTRSYKENFHQPLAILRATMLKDILEEMSIFIEPETFLAGNHASLNRAAPIFPEYDMDWVIDELNDFEKRDNERFFISEKNKDALREIAVFWENNTISARGHAAMPTESKVFYDLGIIRAEGGFASGSAYAAINYALLLDNGLDDVKKRALNKLGELDLTDQKNIGKSYFLKGVEIAVDAVISFAERFSNLAEKMAHLENSAEREAELLEISRILRKVPKGPAETFWEAVQSVWLLHLVLQIESNGRTLSFGRMDQYLYPFYVRDLNSGKITEDFALELLNNLWLKTFAINKIRSHRLARVNSGGAPCQSVTIAGQTRDGLDAVNPLTYLILKSVAQTGMPQPDLIIRHHKKIDEKFMDKCLEYERVGKPMYTGDAIVIPMFIEKDIERGDAYDYSATAGAGVAIPGSRGYRCMDMSIPDFHRALLVALNNGADPKSGTKVCDAAGHFRDMLSYDDVFAAWDKVIRELARHSIIIDSCADIVLRQNTADILCSALCDDCIERGQSVNEGGAVYDYISNLYVGIEKFAETLTIIKKYVFEDKAVSPAELWSALKADYKSGENRMVRELLPTDAKQGNDDSYTQELLRKACDVYIDEVRKYNSRPFFPRQSLH